MTRILVFQHHPSEHPGVFREFLAEDGIAWDAVELDGGEEIPALSGYDALWVFGGPMDTWQEDRHSWLVPEKKAIREWVEDRDLPFLGVCLGHQLLADALGGAVGVSKMPEVGVCSLEVLKDDPLIGKAGARPKALQWHSAEITAGCPGMEILAASPLSRPALAARLRRTTDALGDQRQPSHLRSLAVLRGSGSTVAGGHPVLGTPYGHEAFVRSSVQAAADSATRLIPILDRLLLATR